MTTNKIIRKIANETGIPFKVVNSIIHGYVGYIRESLENFEEVNIYNLGTINMKFKTYTDKEQIPKYISLYTKDKDFNIKKEPIPRPKFSLNTDLVKDIQKKWVDFCTED